MSARNTLYFVSVMSLPCYRIIN
uniref:Uncharacterized protein n=1 Tax=Anguilla anguilla TaxID=7936 RepID=A0A0E9U6W6_ANGAN